MPQGTRPTKSGFSETAELKNLQARLTIGQAGRMSYPSDLSDVAWETIAPFFARPDPRGAREKYPKRRMVEACSYRLREDCRWGALPKDFPPYDPVHDHWARWKKRGVWQEAVLVLNTRWREEQLGRGRRAPRHAILDRQRVKTAAEGEAHGFHGGKMTKGRSRHVAVGSQGTLLAVHVTAANASDSSQAGAVMAQAKESYPTLESFTADQGYRRQAERAAPGLDGELHVTAKPKKRLCLDRLSLAGRAHFRLAGPVPPARQRLREDCLLRRSLDLDCDAALAGATTCMINSTVSKRRSRAWLPRGWRRPARRSTRF